jgi:hypothetical protein
VPTPVSVNVKVTGIPAVYVPPAGLTVGGEMTVAAEAEALSAPTTTAGTSKRFQWITSSPGWRQPNSFRLFNIVGNEGYVWHHASDHPAAAAKKSEIVRMAPGRLDAAAVNDAGSRAFSRRRQASMWPRALAAPNDAAA